MFIRTVLLTCALTTNNTFETGWLHLEKERTRPTLDVFTLDGVPSDDEYNSVVGGDGMSSTNLYTSPHSLSLSAMALFS